MGCNLSIQGDTSIPKNTKKKQSEYDELMGNNAPKYYLEIN